MQNKVRNISSGQLVMLLVLGRIFTLLTFAPHADRSVSGSTSMLTIPLAAVGALVLLIPYFLLRKRGGADTLASAFRVSRIYGTVIAVAFFLFCVFMAAYTASHFAFFMSSTVYQNTTSWAFVLLLLAVAAYAALLGLEAFSRMGGFVFALTVAVVLLMVFSLLPQINPVYLVSPLAEGVEAVGRGTFYSITTNTELAVFVLLLPRTRDGGGKTAAWWVVLAAAFYELLTFITLTVLGDFAGMRQFPLHTVSVITQIPLLGRLDILQITVWIFVAFLRATLYLYCACSCLRKITRRLPMGAGVSISLVLAAAGALMISFKLETLEQAGKIIATGIPLAVLLLAFPLVTLLFPKAKKPS